MKIKITKSGVKIFLSHIFGLLILLFFTNLMILYSQGRFEVPFIDRTKSSVGKIEIETRVREANTDYRQEESTEELLDIKHVINPDFLISATESAANTEVPGLNLEATAEPAPDFELFSDDLRQKGFNVTDGIYEIYDENYINAQINNYKSEVNKILLEAENNKKDEADEINLDLLDLPEKPLLYEYKLVKIEPEFQPAKKTRIVSYTSISKLAVEPIMDYIIMRDDESNVLCDASGKIIMQDFDNSGYEILKMRDDLGNTVFKKDNLYYIYEPYESDGGEIIDFVNIKFSEVLGNRGVPFMYPSYYGANGANGLDRGHNPVNIKRWGYKYAGTENVKIGRIYDKTFNFSENIGIAYQDDPGRGNKLYFLNDAGTRLNPNADFYAPNESDITQNHLGFFYFDHGFTRAYQRQRIEFSYVEKEVLIDVTGKQFHIPEDYEIKAYSNGMILLEKNGYFGFMNYLGEWVGNPIYTYAQPFYEGVAVIGLENGKKALIDTDGSIILKFKYDNITNCTGGIIAYYEKGVGWTILNKVKRQIEIE